MVVTETLQVILNAKDQLTSKINEVNNALRQTGTAANTASASATSATTRLGNAYTQLQNKVRTVFNNIKTTIRNSTAGKIVSESSLAQPFLNAAEKIRQKWTSMTETLKSKMKSLSSSSNTTVGFNISPAGLATLNGQVTTTTGKVTALGSVMNMIASGASRLGLNFGTAFTTASSKIEGFKSKLQSVGTKMTSLVGGLSGVQSAIMGAFGAVGVTSISQFTIGAAIAREKVNAVTKEVVGSGKAFESVNSKIKSAISGTTLGYNNMATAVNNVALRFHLTGEKVGELAGPMSKIGILAQAMGKSTEEAASVMEHAFDGLQGKWKALKQYGIDEATLKAAGWSGAADDVYGYARALDKVLEKNPQFKEFTHTFEYQFQSLKMSIQAVGTEIGMMVLPILNTLVGMFLDLNKQCPWLTKIIVVLAIGILGLVSALSVLAPIIMMIVELHEMEAFATLAAYWPYLLIAAAILVVIGILLYLYNTNEGVRNTMNKIGETIRNVLIKAWDELQKIVQPLATTFDHLKQVLGRLATQLLAAFGITGDAAKEFDWLSAVIQFLGLVLEVIVTHLVTVAEVIASIVVPVISFLVNVVANLINFFVSLGEALTLLSQGDVMGFLTVLGEALYTFIVNTIANFGQMFLEIWNNLSLIFGGLLSSVWTWLVQLITAMIWGGWQMVIGFLMWIASLPGQFWNYLVMCWNNFLNWAGQMIAKASEAGNKVVTDFINWITSLPGKFWTWLLNTINKIKDFKDQAVQKMKDTAKKMVDDFIEYVKKLPSKFGEWLGKIKDEIWARRGALVSAIIRLGWDLLREFKNALLGSVFGSAEVGDFNRMVYDGLSSAGSMASRAGYLIGNSFNAGVLDGMDKAGLDNIGISGNGQVLASVEHEISNRQGDSQTQLLQDIKDALGSLRVEHTGSIDFNQNVDVTGDTGLTSDELRSAVMQALQDRNVLKQIVQSREFQSMDKRMKNRMIQEMSRHI